MDARTELLPYENVCIEISIGKKFKSLMPDLGKTTQHIAVLDFLVIWVWNQTINAKTQ